MQNWLIHKKVNLSRPQCVENVVDAGLIYVGDNLAHKWAVECFYGNEVADLSGYSAKAYFIRNDKATVILDGSIEGHTAVVTLNNSCYRIAGGLKGVLKIIDAKTGASIAVGAMYVRVSVDSTDTIVDEENIVPSLSDLLAEIEAMRNATSEAREITETATKAEEGRVNAESQRVSAEASRQAAEKSRVSAEAARVAAEKERGTALGGLSFSINPEDNGIDIYYNG